jgi:hypothetical protein
LQSEKAENGPQICKFPDIFPVIREFEREGRFDKGYKITPRSVGGGFCGNELTLEFSTKSMPSGSVRNRGKTRGSLVGRIGAQHNPG